MSEMEFVRGNQQNYIRVPCQEDIYESYEYRMCANNHLKSLLPFVPREYDGQKYLYYQVGGMQSLDVLLQAQKLKRRTMLILAKGIVRLSREFSEYALDMHRIIWNPKYIMLSSGGEEVLFLYPFSESADGDGLELLFETCVEHLDYSDELLAERVYQGYESLLSQGENFILEEEMQGLISILEEAAPETEDVSDYCAEEVQIGGNASTVTVEEELPLPKSKVYVKEQRNLRRGMLFLLAVDILMFFVLRPLNLLQIFFLTAAGGVPLVICFRLFRQDRASRKEQDKVSGDDSYIREYKELSSTCRDTYGGTQIIALEQEERVLFNLQSREPTYIYFGESQKLLGKDAEKVEVHLPYEGVSRVHARLFRKDGECLVEDLNSTNGTRINGKELKPREAHALNLGDKVSFAGLEYIFR